MKLRLAIKYAFARRCLKCKAKAHFLVKLTHNRWDSISGRSVTVTKRRLYVCWYHKDDVIKLAKLKSEIKGWEMWKPKKVQFVVWMKKPPPDPEAMAALERELRLVK